MRRSWPGSRRRRGRPSRRPRRSPSTCSSAAAGSSTAPARRRGRPTSASRRPHRGHWGTVRREGRHRHRRARAASSRRASSTCTRTPTRSPSIRWPSTSCAWASRRSSPATAAARRRTSRPRSRAIEQDRCRHQLRDAGRPQHRAPRGDGHRAARADSGRTREDAGARRSRRCATAPSASRPACSTCRAPTPTQSEIVALARTAAQSGGLYATHMRNEGTELEAAVKEALDDRRSGAVPGRDLAPQGRRAEPMGRQRQGARDDRRGAGEGHDGQRRRLSLRRGQLHARHPVSVVGARRRPGRDQRAAGRCGDVGADQGGDEEADSRARARELQLRAHRFVSQPIRR